MPRRRRHKKAGKPSQVQEPGDDAVTREDVSYHVKESDTLGRYLVASRDLPEGSVIVSEDPLVVGPVQESPPVCLGCYTSITDINAAEKCGSCKWPICSKNCQGLEKTYGHSKEECLQLTSCPLESSNLSTNHLYNAIFPLRCLMLRDHQPDKWRILMTMEAHNDIRRKLKSIWDYNQKSVVDRIRKEWNISKFDEEEIHTVCGFAEVNAFSIGGDSVNIQGIYPSAFYLSHDCVANTSHSDEEYHITIFMSMSVFQGDTLTLSYTNSLQGTIKRREHLRKCKFFDCSCRRCSDPTELGTYMSAVKCKDCSKGRVLPLEPLKDDSDWRCDNKQCNCSHPVKDVAYTINRIEKEIEDLDHNSIRELEAAILRYSELLHQSHYHIVGLKYTLSQLYGKSAGFLIHEMSDTALERKIQICEDILRIFDILEPGLTRIRGITMYELHAPLMILTIKRSEKHKMAKSAISKNLKNVAFYLRECIRLLKFEPKTSQEGVIRDTAEESLAQLKTWEPVVGQL